VRQFGLWRPFFLLGGILIILGGPRHPDGTMAEMLADPDWVPSHALMFAGFAALLVGLFFYRRSASFPDRTRRWVRWALFGTALQALEMAIHTAASVDLANLVAGRPTPVLTTHLALSVVAYPVFGLTSIGLIIAGARDRALGSLWIAWIGVVGALAWGLSAPLVILTDVGWAGILFPGIAVFALWLVLAAAWPLRARTPAS
jgi:hypothetical protein